MKRENYSYDQYPQEGIAGIERDLAIALAVRSLVPAHYYLKSSLYAELNVNKSLAGELAIRKLGLMGIPQGFCQLGEGVIKEIDASGEARLTILNGSTDTRRDSYWYLVLGEEPIMERYMHGDWPNNLPLVSREEIVFFTKDIEDYAKKNGGSGSLLRRTLEQHARQTFDGSGRQKTIDITLLEALQLAGKEKIRAFIWVENCRHVLISTQRQTVIERSDNHFWTGFLELPDYSLLELEMTGEAEIDKIRFGLFGVSNAWKEDDSTGDIEVYSYLKEPIAVSIKDIVFKTEEIERVTAEGFTATSQNTQEISDNELLKNIQ